MKSDGHGLTLNQLISFLRYVKEYKNPYPLIQNNEIKPDEVKIDYSKLLVEFLEKEMKDETNRTS